MSYRALVSLIHKNLPGVRVDYTMRLDEDFKNGEAVAEHLGTFRTYAAAIIAILENDGGLEQRHWDSPEGREEWVGLWADQLWTVTFDQEGDFCRVQIDGYDAGSTPIFMRATVYHIGGKLMGSFYIWFRLTEGDWAWQSKDGDLGPFGGHSTRRKALLEAAEQFSIDTSPPVLREAQ